MRCTNFCRRKKHQYQPKKITSGHIGHRWVALSCQSPASVVVLIHWQRPVQHFFVLRVQIQPLLNKQQAFYLLMIGLNQHIDITGMPVRIRAKQADLQNRLILKTRYWFEAGLTHEASYSSGVWSKDISNFNYKGKRLQVWRMTNKTVPPRIFTHHEESRTEKKESS